MKRIGIALGVVFLLTLSVSAADSGYTFKIGFSTNMEDPRAKAAQQFAAEIKRKSYSALDAEIYPSGQLGGDAALIEAVTLDSGTVDIIISDASNFATYEPMMGISALPFNFKSYEDAWAFMDSDLEKEAEKLLIQHNIRVLAHYCNGFRCITTSKTAINSPADMKGLLIRTPENPVIMATMRALGANPQPLAFSELYMALQQGTYDAQENPIPVIWNNKLYEVQKNLTVTNHIYSGMCFAISEKVWVKLTDAEKKIVAEAAENSAAYNRALNRKMAEDFIDDLAKAGMNIIIPDLEPFMEATRSVVADARKTYGGDMLRWLAEWKALR